MIVFGISTLVWIAVGVGRYVAERGARQRGHGPVGGALSPADVAIIIAAHNEAAVIDDAVECAAVLLPRTNIFVVSDASTDETAEICRDAGVNVLDLTVNRGKAGAIVAGLQHFEICRRFEVVMLMDADTRPLPDYLSTGLREFEDPGVVAVAGYAMSCESPLPPTRMGAFLVRYRQRFYAVLQVLFKYGQSAKRVNVLSIVPGFASMYRASAIADIEIDAPGLIIEDST
ncbi:MAG TPA: glycosyltransferase family 2 protein [Aldersonia sp.]